MIKPNEAVVLTELRKTTLAYLSDLEFKEVEKAVERDGILSLQGYVATIVKDAVLKHGSHNQSSHGGKGGGKGGGGGGGASPSPIASSEASDKARTTTAKVLVDDMSAAEDAMDSVADRLSSSRDEVTLNRAANHITSAKKDFSDATKLKGKAQTEKMQTGVGKVFAATDQLSIIDDKRTDDIAAGILDDVQATFGDSDSAFADLGLDVDDLFGP